MVPKYLDRHRVKTGVTGWAQVNGFRGDTSIEERIKYDLYYIENWSLAFDVKILLRTLRAALMSRENAPHDPAHRLLRPRRRPRGRVYQAVAGGGNPPRDSSRSSSWR